MKKDKGGDGIFMLLPYLVAPIGLAIGHLFDVDWDTYGFLIVLILGACLLIGPFVIGMLLYNLFDKSQSEGHEPSSTMVSVAALALSIVLACVLVQPFGKTDLPAETLHISQTETSYQNNERIAAYYQNNYPMVWGYIRRNAEDPYEYIGYYHDVWGDLQRYTGDGINFDTLGKYEQSLVNYPSIGMYVYFSTAKSRTYHSTRMCYALLKTDPITRPSHQRFSYSPCSKCVGE